MERTGEKWKKSESLAHLIQQQSEIVSQHWFNPESHHFIDLKESVYSSATRKQLSTIRKCMLNGDFKSKPVARFFRDVKEKLERDKHVRLLRDLKDVQVLCFGGHNFSFSQPVMNKVLLAEHAKNPESFKNVEVNSLSEVLTLSYKEYCISRSGSSGFMGLMGLGKNHVDKLRDYWQQAGSIKSLKPDDESLKQSFAPHPGDDFFERLDIIVREIGRKNWVSKGKKTPTSVGLIAHALLCLDWKTSTWEDLFKYAEHIRKLISVFERRRTDQDAQIRKVKKSVSPFAKLEVSLDVLFEAKGDPGKMRAIVEKKAKGKLDELLNNQLGGDILKFKALIETPIAMDIYKDPEFKTVAKTIEETRTKILEQIAPNKFSLKDTEMAFVEHISNASKDASNLFEMLQERRKEVKEWESTKKTWERGLVKSNKVKELLGITPTETKRWIEDGRIPTVRKEAFYKWGQTLYATLHDSSQVDQWKNQIPKWRKQDDAVKTKNRKAAAERAKATKNARQEIVKRAKLADYSALFPEARKLTRTFTFFMGPTNSGKTFKALERLTRAKSGVYAAPLRLMASENQERIQNSGTPCSLITGEESKLDPSASHESCTIEMLDTRSVKDVIVIDECQMILDRDRGWAWTQAIVGAPAKEVILTGSPEALEVIQALVDETGDKLIVSPCERLSDLSTEVTSIKKGSLKSGDAVICFSRKRIMEVREELQTSGWTVATIYGNLSPEVRRMESSRFEKGDAQILVATDAIGMGLNLPINRVVFADVEKFDGQDFRLLTDSEFRQIAGRAGRYGISESGSVHTLGNAGFARNDIVRSIRRAADSVGHTGKFQIMPPLSAFVEASKFFETNNVVKLLNHIQKAFPKNSIWQSAVSENMIEQAKIVEDSGSNLDVADKFRYLMAPVKLKSHDWKFSILIDRHSSGSVNYPKTIGKQGLIHEGSLRDLEEDVHELDLYIWLARHFSEVYPDESLAREQRAIADQQIMNHLREKALKKLCEDCFKPIPKKLHHKKCDDCFRESRGFYYW